MDRRVKMTRPDLIIIASRILKIAEENSHPLKNTIDVEGLAEQLEYDLKTLQKLGKNGLIEAGNFRLSWINSKVCCIQIFPSLEEQHPIETHYIRYR